MTAHREEPPGTLSRRQLLIGAGAATATGAGALALLLSRGNGGHPSSTLTPSSSPIAGAQNTCAPGFYFDVTRKVCVPFPPPPAGLIPPDPPDLSAFADPGITVLDFGAKPDNGATDNSGPFKAALAAAQAKGGAVVHVTGLAGTPAIYGFRSGFNAARGNPVALVGAGRDAVELVQLTAGSPLLTLHPDHCIAMGFTADCQAHNGDTAIGMPGNFGYLYQVRALGAPVNKSNHVAGWVVRFPGPPGASQTAPAYSRGNTINDLILHDLSGQGNGGLGFPFQSGGRIHRVIHTGTRLDAYINESLTVLDYYFVADPTVVQSNVHGWHLTAPVTAATIANFISDGPAGRVGTTGLVKTPLDNVRLLNLQAPGTLEIGDVTNMLVQDSTVGAVTITPTVAAQVRFVNSHHGPVTERPGLGAMIAAAGL